MRNGEERRVTKSCPDGEFFWIYLTTIRVLLNDLSKKALNKMQSFHALFFFVFRCFFKNVEQYADRAWSQLSKSLLLIRNGQKYI